MTEEKPKRRAVRWTCDPECIWCGGTGLKMKYDRDYSDGYRLCKYCVEPEKESEST